jgi:hypothetical protein
MESMTPADRETLINAIATREGSARELAKRYGYTKEELVNFLNNYRSEIEQRALLNHLRDTDQPPADMVTPTQLDELWITQKFERLKRLQDVADMTYKDIMSEGLTGAELATEVREFRSYLMLAANELGQLLHRGSGDSGTGDTLSVDIQGVDMDNLR